MVFNPPTELNMVDSDRFMYERSKILHYNYNLRLRPHIFSDAIIEIRYNQYIQTPTKMPPECNIYVAIRSSKKYCQKINGQIVYPRGNTCTEESTPLVFKSGNSDIEACHSACFNLFDKKKDKTGTAYRSPFTKFNEKQNCCSIYNNDMFALGVDDYNRTDSHITPRLDTIGTGFDLDDEPYTDLEGNETFKFIMNKYYCDEFMKKWDGEKCYTPLYEEIFGAVVSSSLYKACQYGVRYFQTGLTINAVNKPNLPPIVTDPPKNKDDWLQDVNSEAFFINPNLTLKDLGITNPGLKHLIFTTEHGWPGRLVEPLIVYQELGSLQSNVDVVDFDNINKQKLKQFKTDSYGWRIIDEYEFLNIYTNIKRSALANRKNDAEKNTPDDRSSWQKYFAELFDKIASSFSTRYTLYMLVGGVVGDVVIRNLIKVMTETAIAVESGAVTSFIAILCDRLMIHSLFPVLMQPAFKLIALTLKLLTSVFKTAEVVMTIGGLVDLLDIGVDYFNFKHELGVRSIQQYSELDISTRKKNYGYGTVDYSPVMLMSMYEYITVEENGGSNQAIHANAKRNANTLPPFSEYCSLLKDYNKNDAKWKLKLEDVVDRYDYLSCMLWSSQYLYSLDINSNGLPINWNEDQVFCEIKDLNEFFDTTFKSFLNTFDNYSDFTQNFKKKINLLKYVVPAAFIFIVAFAFMKMIYAVIFLFFVSSAVYAIVFTDALTAETVDDDYIN